MSRKPYLTFIYACVLFFSLGCSEGLGFRHGAGRFLCLSGVSETAGVQRWSAAGACVCARPPRRLGSATGDQFAQRLVY